MVEDYGNHMFFNDDKDIKKAWSPWTIARSTIWGPRIALQVEASNVEAPRWEV